MVSAVDHHAEREQCLAIPFAHEIDWRPSGESQQLQVITLRQWQCGSSAISYVPLIACRIADRYNVLKRAQEALQPRLAGQCCCDAGKKCLYRYHSRERPLYCCQFPASRLDASALWICTGPENDLRFLAHPERENLRERRPGNGELEQQCSPPRLCPQQPCSLGLLLAELFFMADLSEDEPFVGHSFPASGYFLLVERPADQLAYVFLKRRLQLLTLAKCFGE